MGRLVLALLATLSLSGCLGASVAPAANNVGVALQSDPIVVAILDTGVNPYHVAFAANRTGGASSWPMSVNYTEVDLSDQGTFQERTTADASTWSTLATREIYAFKGTRLMAYSVAPGDLGAIRDSNGHGTGTAFMVASAYPEATILMVQVSGELCTTGNCIVDPSVPDALQWVAQQPWIDVVSVSLNIPGNPPLSSVASEDAAAYLRASRAAADSGKLIINSAGNYVAPPLNSYFAGPPWIIAVGGVEDYSRGESPFGGKGVDVVANYSAYVPEPDSLDSFTWTSGTSFAAPLVAGTIAQAIGIVSEVEPDLWRNAPPTPQRATPFRDALNASAVYWAPTDWDPGQMPREDDPIGNAIHATVPIVAPFAQMGWGHVSSVIAPTIAERVLHGSLDPPPEKRPAQEFQAAWQHAREIRWAMS